jgi:hypothetical protein
MRLRGSSPACLGLRVARVDGRRVGASAIRPLCSCTEQHCDAPGPPTRILHFPEGGPAALRSLPAPSGATREPGAGTLATTPSSWCSRPGVWRSWARPATAARRSRAAAGRGGACANRRPNSLQRRTRAAAAPGQQRAAARAGVRRRLRLRAIALRWRSLASTTLISPGRPAGPHIASAAPNWRHRLALSRSPFSPSLTVTVAPGIGERFSARMPAPVSVSSRRSEPLKGSRKL